MCGVTIHRGVSFYAFLSLYLQSKSPSYRLYYDMSLNVPSLVKEFFSNHPNIELKPTKRQPHIYKIQSKSHKRQCHRLINNPETHILIQKWLANTLDSMKSEDSNIQKKHSDIFLVSLI